MAMGSSKHYCYFVEGENEKKLVQVLKTELQVIPAGDVDKLNVLTKKIQSSRMLTLQKNTIVVLIFDTDVMNINLNLFEENIRNLNHCRNISSVICITQVKNLEDELVRSTNIKSIEELLQSRSRKEFKNDFNRIEMKRLAQKLKEHSFKINKLWAMNPDGIYQSIENQAYLIKERI